MDLIGYVVFIIIVISSVVKAISGKICANKFKYYELPFFNSFYILIALTCLGIYDNSYFKGMLNYNTAEYGITVGKGIGLFIYTTLGFYLSSYTASSRSFMNAFSIGFIAVSHFFIFGVEITTNQLISAILITLLGSIYYFKGHLAEMNYKTHLSFFALVLLSIILATFDQVGLKTIDWFTFLFISCFISVCFSLSINYKNYIQNFKYLFFNKYIILSSLIYLAVEVFSTIVRVKYISMTMNNIAYLMAVPFIMLSMYFFFNESTFKKQMFFGWMTFLFGLIALI